VSHPRFLESLGLWVHYCIDCDTLQKKNLQNVGVTCGANRAILKCSASERALSIISGDFCSIIIFSKCFNTYSIDIEKQFWPHPHKKLENDLEASNKQIYSKAMTKTKLTLPRNLANWNGKAQCVSVWNKSALIRRHLLCTRLHAWWKACMGSSTKSSGSTAPSCVVSHSTRSS